MTNKTTYKKMITLLFIITVLTTAITCNPNLTGPYEDPPGRRDYTWTVDTLIVPEADDFYASRMWGSSPEDIWVCGFGSANCKLYHFDGKNWKGYPEIKGDFKGLYGFASNDVWLTGVYTVGRIDLWHFDGSSWKLKDTIRFPGTHSAHPTNIWGDSPGNVYLTGFVNEDTDGNFYGFIYKYNGLWWRNLNLPKVRVGFQVCRYKNEELVIRGTTDDEYIGKIYSYKNNKLKELYSGSLTVGFGVHFIKGHILIQIGTVFYEYTNGVMKLSVDLGENYYGGMWGRNPKDIFCDTKQGIGHFNGTDLVTLKETASAKETPFDALLFENKVVFWGWSLVSGVKNLIYTAELME